MYVLDTSSINVFKSYYPKLFPTFWGYLQRAVDAGQVHSVREVLHEVTQTVVAAHVREWAEANRKIFHPPSHEEGMILRRIFSYPKFHEVISKKTMQNGMPCADPFLVARAKHHDCFVVTEEAPKPNSAKIPTVCKKLGVKCINLEGLMRREGWTF